VVSIQRNARNVLNERKKVRNKRSWRNGQNARIEAVVASAAFVALRTLLALRWMKNKRLKRCWSTRIRVRFSAVFCLGHRRNFVCDSGDCHHHFLKVEFSYFHIKIPTFPSTLEFGQENGIFLTIVQKRSYRKCDSGRGSSPDSAGAAYDAPPGSLVGWGGDSPPYSGPHSAPFDARSFGASIVVPPPDTKFLATPLVTTTF